MKRFLISMVALLAVVGCAQQEELVSADLGAVNAPEFKVGFESSRVYIDETDAGFKLAWTKGDLLSCFLNAGGQAQYEYVGETGENNGIIKAISCPSGEAIDAFYAIYPYNEANSLADGVLSLVLPAEQAYAEGTFGPNSNAMVAVNTAKEPYYTFSNVCGYIRLKVYGDATITSIKFEGLNDEVIAGAATYNTANSELAIAGEGKTITLNCGEGVALGATEAEATEFWLVVPPMTFDEGFSVTLAAADGKQMTKTLGTAFTVERNAVHTGVIEYEADSDVLVDIKFGADNTAEDKGAAALAVRFIDPNEYNAPQYPAANRPVLANTYAYGDGYIARFNHTPSGMGNQTSYFLADFSENAELQAALTDGFTMEVVYMNTIINGAPTYMVSAGCWGLGMGANNSNAPIGSPLRAYLNAGVTYNNWGTYFDSDTKSSPVVFNHALYVYDQVNAKVQLYINGQFEREIAEVTTFNIGTELAIGAASYIDAVDTKNDLGLHGWAGDIASVKIYNNVKSAAEAEALYQAAAIPVWNPAQETLPQPIYDAQIEDGGVVSNKGTMTSLVTERMLDAEGNTPYMETIKVGAYNVINFTHPNAGDVCPNKDWNPNNYTGTIATYPDGSYYRVGWENTEFDAALVDGDFTLEIICAAATSDNWRVPAGTASFHLNQRSGKYWMQSIKNNYTHEWTYYSDYVFNIGEYHHIVYVSNVDGKRMCCAYVNGKQDSGFGGHGDVFANPHCLIIGACIWPDKNMTRPYNGQVAAVRVYDRSLSPSEVGAIYSNNKPMIDALNAQ